VYIFFDKRGDITDLHGSNGIWRQCHFLWYKLGFPKRTLELQFRVNNQTKGLVLSHDDIKTFDDLGIYFQHLTRSDFIMFNPFACEEFVLPHANAIQYKEMIESCMRD
jgi:hypothetical protein